MESEKRKGRDLVAQMNWSMRRVYFQRLIEELETRTSFDTYLRRVFVSYSKRTGEQYFKYLETRLRERHDLEVTTGYHGSSPNVLGRVLKELKGASLFVGLLTREYRIVDGVTEKWAPSSWVLEEKGMALALGLPFVVLVEEAVDAELFTKTTRMDVYIDFAASNYQERFDQAIEQLAEKHEAKLDQISRESFGLG